MRKLIVLSLLLITANAFAHAGHVHNVLGTVKSVAANEVVVAKTDGSSATITLSDTTKYEGGSRADLAAGRRVSIYLADDGKTAVRVKFGVR